jgi:hypothetical protein
MRRCSVVVSNICGRILPGEEERLAAQAEFELFAKTTELASAESKRPDRIEWGWNQGWE